ncbi:hypothetical protein J008_02132 [Cryptococcus neoformans]|uniref:Uncharacterized protein n=2 Tax=Cryptococcus neoformans TaxID=5207 RepID=A0A854QG36_CRYNE|nr:hypothetical protein CNAG_07803 [Cryptococcus neoformans var. grubii H99]AUB23925.1 hypothetical protein CKF44_07803 [Cryptococcus neoformans var. grubii]OWZ33407.1 hypothetical protein C347_02428 [Cryptococcus neoformans var. grubii AD2-60a]OWZ45503.1 hypothetical protein C343_02360 [Cryptococcus neoformans var. grubii C23]OWZ47796.1 hypothetical protein C353_02262 [Cryptococcus neoformans var. grubii AD1-83a]OWZ55052.1 hypothetical protein C368_02849 [Cryptococcus neoformans var. grubii 1|eukprot:XP_012048468.1 hypothetical protein CNAG_07803 [Cryptococcus neoformans var. grubii H99]
MRIACLPVAWKTFVASCLMLRMVTRVSLRLVIDARWNHWSNKPSAPS